MFRKKGSSKNSSSARRKLSKDEHLELVKLCEKALATKKLTISKVAAIAEWFDVDFNRALDPLASELFCHCCDVEQYGETSLTQSMRDCISYTAESEADSKPRLIRESTNEFKPFQEIRMDYSSKNGELSSRHIIFIKSSIRPIKKRKTDITAICKESEYCLNFVKERMVSYELVD